MMVASTGGGQCMHKPRGKSTGGSSAASLAPHLLSYSFYRSWTLPGSSSGRLQRRHPISHSSSRPSWPHFALAPSPAMKEPGRGKRRQGGAKPSWKGCMCKLQWRGRVLASPWVTMGHTVNVRGAVCLQVPQGRELAAGKPGRSVPGRSVHYRPCRGLARGTL